MVNNVEDLQVYRRKKSGKWVASRMKFSVKKGRISCSYHLRSTGKTARSPSAEIPPPTIPTSTPSFAVSRKKTSLRVASNFQKERRMSVLLSEAQKDYQTNQVKKPIQSCRVHGITLQKQRQRGLAATSGAIHKKQSIEFPSVNGEKGTRNIAEEGTRHQETLRKNITHRKPVKDKKDQEKQLIIHSCQAGAGGLVEVSILSLEETQRGCSPSAGLVSEKQTIEIHPANGDKVTGTPTIQAQKHVSEEGPQQKTFRDGIIHFVSGADITSIIQSDSSSTIKFEGLDIRSSLVPTLQKIWSKHGNIIENCLMRNGDIVTKALESLATLVLILTNNSVQSLSDHLADYLSSTLSDLKFICFKVDWLVPFVEKAVRLHKGKTLIDSFNKLSHLNDQAAERRSILLDELAEVEERQKKRKEELADLSKRISCLGEMDLNLPLGGGLV